MSNYLGKSWTRLVDVGFRLLYNEMAWTYDAVSWSVSFGHWRAWQRAAVQFVTGRRVLEIAHGPGHMLPELHRRGHAAVGLDLSPYMSHMARRRLQRAGLAAAVPLVRADVHHLPFAAGTFDAALATFPTAFILEPATLTAVRRVLVPGGRFVILPEAHLTGEGPMYTFVEWLFTITGQRPREGGPEQVWRPFEQRLGAAGFEVTVETVTLEGSAATVIVAAVA